MHETQPKILLQGTAKIIVNKHRGSSNLQNIQLFSPFTPPSPSFNASTKLYIVTIAISSQDSSA
jgi:hypothetical protein